ncbi:hypothetical protein, partial [Candidatus Regiella insecticola]|uniref:hypothetical protein n=1 Tax=Candidatus Regiella insecticola TaxID=138073 RepID=UPI001C3F571B
TASSKFISPNYNVQNKQFNNVGDALTMLNKVVTKNSTDITELKKLSLMMVCYYRRYLAQIY